MKIFKIILLLSVVAVFTNAMTMKTKEENQKTVFEVIKSEKNDYCVKPGLSVEFSYSSEHVNTGAVAKVKSILTTPLTEGVLKVQIKSIDNNLLEFEEKNLEFELSADQPNIFPINLEVSSEVDGEYYLTFFTSVEGKGGRVFEIPVKFGTIVEKALSKNVSYTDEGTAIIVSNAEEEIK